MPGRSFVDTNVLVYLFDADAPAKRQRARDLLKEEAAGIVLSTQVLTEFYVATTRKLAKPLPEPEAAGALEELCAFDVVDLSASLVRDAVSRAQRDRMSPWDALIVEAALAAGCERLLTEDLQDGRIFDGRLTVTNPFAAARQSPGAATRRRFGG